MADRVGEQLEGGFTVLELIVVLSVIAVLIGVSVPTFVRARNTAQEGAARADLRTAIEAVNTVYIDAQSFGNVTRGDLSAAEPRLQWHDTRTAGPDSLAVLTGVIVAETGTPAIGLAVQSADGKCYYAYQADNDAPWYGSGDAAGGCNANDAAQLASSRSI